MPSSKYLNISIDKLPVDVAPVDSLPIVISDKIEDAEDFQKKQSAQAFNINLPATTRNDRVSNTFHNPSIADMSPGGSYRRPRSGLIEANTIEIMVGKCFLKKATHASCPLDYLYDFYGDNGDWMIPLTDTTLYDFLHQIVLPYTADTIINSWNFDGTSEALPYVFAPVRYGQPMDEGIDMSAPAPVTPARDMNMPYEYMRPSLSAYWIIYWAFKSLGYQVQSEFMNSDYFRRLVMPWTWGNFQFSDGTKYDIHKFKAASVGERHLAGTTSSVGDRFIWWDLNVINDSSDGMFDNNTSVPNGDYTYSTVLKEMKWKYNAPDFGTIIAGFSMTTQVDASAWSNSDVALRVYWYKNGVEISHEEIANATAPYISVTGTYDIGLKEADMETTVVAGDEITAKLKVRIYESKGGSGQITASVKQFSLDYFKIPLGGTIYFDNYNALKKHKFLDFMRGIVDLFNIVPRTDPISKIVLLEPEHGVALGNDFNIDFNSDFGGGSVNGRLNGTFLDWNGKQDLHKTSELPLFADSEREITFKFRDDGSDGILKTVQDRNSVICGSCKYVFPDHFKTGKKDSENRFFSPVMHYEVKQWKYITGVTPQMVCLIPENISNTSKEESQNTFGPKLCWYKGKMTDAGGWKINGGDLTYFPYMFAVNYQPGGENDPILSYTDELIGNVDSGYTIGRGILKRFFWQRLAIMRNGQYYSTWFKINNFDIANRFKREHIICRGQKWELVEIKNYKPLGEETTSVDLRMWVPISMYENANTFPLADTITSGVISTNPFDIKYSPLKCLTSDISTG